MKRILCFVLCLTLCLSFSAALAPSVGAIGSSFFNNHTDWHFDLTKEPNRPMTVEELIALTTSYSYWSTGLATGETPRDKNGNLPSDWAAPYIRMEAAKGTIDPSRLVYNAPATLGFFIRLVVRNKGLYSYNARNIYSFVGTAGYNAEELLLLSVAVDYGLAGCKAGMDVSAANLLRKDLEAKYLIPAGSVSPVTSVQQQAVNYPWSMLWFEDTYNYYSPEYNHGWTPWYDEPTALEELENVKRYAGNFNVVNLCVQLMNKDGSDGSFCYEDRVCLKRAHLELIDYCKSNGIKILCGVFNYYTTATMQAIQADPSKAGAAADELMRYVDTYGFDGINLDIELFGNTYRSAYTALVRALSTRLHAKGKLLVATVGAYFTEKDEANSLYDYDMLRETCDLVNVILYDDHPARGYNAGTSGIGPVSDYASMLRRVMYAAVKLGPEKMMLSVANYGVDYNTGDHTAVGLTRTEVNTLIQAYHPTVQTTSSEVDDAWFTYTDGSGKPHTVYYETDTGVQHRLSYATRFALGGVCVYYAYSDTPEIFKAAGSKLTPELPFRDVEKGWYYEPVQWAVENGITSGTSASTFSPGNPCTRAQVVTFLWRANGSPVPKMSNCPFTDVPRDAYYYQPVLWAVENGITSGTSATTFSPGSPCTRGQVVTFLWRAAGEPADSGSDELPIIPARAVSFADVKPSDYFYSAVLWAVDNGITNGTGTNTFSPGSTCTRAQVVTFLCRAQ